MPYEDVVTIYSSTSEAYEDDPGGVMERFREFLASTGGKISGSIIAILLIFGAGYLVWNALGPSPEARAANERMCVDSTTGKSFFVALKPGMSFPIKAPSGGNTGYLAELCFWKKDGSTREEPYGVILNAALGKAEPTFCPDCGRLVVGHNPGPTPGAKPPPTREEYKPRGRDPRDDR